MTATRRRLARSVSSLPRLWWFVLDLAYPPRCGGCDRRGTLFCDDCLRLVVPVPEQPAPPGLDALVSGGVFAGPLRAAIHKLKYESDTPLRRPLASFIWRAMQPGSIWQDADGSLPTIMAVPLHVRRERRRGCNQSHLLARQLAWLSGWPIAVGLTRVRETRPQVGLHAGERQTNVRGAFAWRGSAQGVPARILLVDDVCTTGATLAECAAVLRAAGARDVYAATVGRALGEGPDAGR